MSVSQVVTLMPPRGTAIPFPQMELCCCIQRAGFSEGDTDFLVLTEVRGTAVALCS